MDCEFRLRARIRLSGDVEESILKGLEEPIRERLNKGVPQGKGVSKLTMKAAERGIDVEIISDRYLRAHDALLRIRKLLAQELGKRRIGLRGIEIQDYHVIFDEDLDVRVRVPFVESMERTENGTLLKLRVGESEIEKRIPDRIISLIEEKRKAREYGSKSEHWELLYESRKKEFKYRGDPTEEMIRRNWIKHGSCKESFSNHLDITR